MGVILSMHNMLQILRDSWIGFDEYNYYHCLFREQISIPLFCKRDCDGLGTTLFLAKKSFELEKRLA